MKQMRNESQESPQKKTSSAVSKIEKFTWDAIGYIISLISIFPIRANPRCTSQIHLLVWPLALLSDAVFIASIVWKLHPFKGLFCFSNMKLRWIWCSFCPKSGPSNDVWAGALSCCKSHETFFHNSLYCCSQAVHNFKIIVFINRTTMW